MVPQEKRLSLRTCSELAQQRCRFVPVNALSWAITLLAVAIGVVAQADKNFQHYELFSSNKRSAEILQQLDASGYITSLTNYGGVGIDLRLASKMVRNQQLWRRQYESNKKERKIQYSLLDCNPLFAAQRSVLSWFRIITLKVALCAHVCQDYPTCTMTTPLMQYPDESLFTLVYCNYTVIFNDTVPGTDQSFFPSKSFQLISETGFKDSYAKICRSAVDSVAPKDNVLVSLQTSTVSKNSTTIVLTNYTTTARPAYAAFNVFVPDLWSNWHIQPTFIYGLNNLSFNCEGYNTLPTQCKPGELCQIDSKQVLHLPSSIVMLRGVPTDHPMLINECTITNSTAYIAIDSMWIIQPRPDNGYIDSTFIEREDWLGGWNSYPFYGTGTSTNRFDGSLVNVNGFCPETLFDMFKVGKGLRSLKPVPCNSLQLLGCTEGSLFDSVYGVRCLNKTNERYIRGCNSNLSAFYLNTHPLACNGNNYAVPALNAPIGLGASYFTYITAKNMYNYMLDVTQRISNSLSGELDTMFTNSKDHYYAIDIVGYWNQTDIKSQLGQAKERTVALVRQWSFHDTQATSIATALVLLFVQVLQIPTHWSKGAQNGIVSWYTSKLSLSSNSALLNAITVFVLRFFASAVRVGPAMFPFVFAVKADAGSSIYSGYPQLTYYNINGGRPNGTYNAYNQARQTAEPLGLTAESLGITTTAIVKTAVQIWAVVLVCTVCGLAVIVVSVWAAVEEYRSLQVDTDIEGVADAETQCDKQMDVQLQMRTESQTHGATLRMTKSAPDKVETKSKNNISSLLQ